MREVDWTRRITTSEFAVDGLRLDVPHPVFGQQECKVWLVTIQVIASARSDFQNAGVMGVKLRLQRRIAPHSPVFAKAAVVRWEYLKAEEPAWLSALIARCRSELAP